MRKKLALEKRTIKPLSDEHLALARGRQDADDATTSGLPVCLSHVCYRAPWGQDYPSTEN
jgi:hypothetical protein